MEQRRIVAELAELKSAIESAMPSASIVPAFQWCQSADQVFISVKFSHKLDAPATLNVEADSVSITDSGLHLAASASKGSSKTFKLDLPFFAPIVPDNSSYSMASVGRMSFTLTKEKPNEKWVRIYIYTYMYNMPLSLSLSRGCLFLTLTPYPCPYRRSLCPKSSMCRPDSASP